MFGPYEDHTAVFIVVFAGAGDTTPGGALDVILQESGDAVLNEDGTFLVLDV